MIKHLMSVLISLSVLPLMAQATYSSTTVTSTNSSIVQGASASSLAGESVAAVGDVNNDGYDDILIGTNVSRVIIFQLLRNGMGEPMNLKKPPKRKAELPLMKPIELSARPKQLINQRTLMLYTYQINLSLKK